MAVAACVPGGLELGLPRTTASMRGIVNPVMQYTLVSPQQFASKDDLAGNGAGIYHLDDVTEEEFDEAVTDAKAEGLSRANVVRNIRGVVGRLSGEPSALQALQEATHDV